MGNHLPGRGPNDCGPGQGGCSHGVAGTGSGRSNLGDADNSVSGEMWTSKARAVELAKASPTGTYTMYPSGSQLNAERAAHPGGGGGGGGGGGSTVNPFDKEELLKKRSSTSGVRESQVDVFDPTDQEQMEVLLGDAFNQEMGGNTFGAGANVGKNSFENSIYQDTSKAINNNHGEAKERAKKFLVFGEGY